MIFLKDSQQLYKSIRNIKKIENEDIDELINVYDEIKMIIVLKIDITI